MMLQILKFLVLPLKLDFTYQEHNIFDFIPDSQHNLYI